MTVRKPSLMKYGVAIIGSSLIASSAIAMLPAQMASAAPATSTSVFQGAVTQANDDEAGVLIARVQRDSPAAKAGLRRGDILLKINDTDVSEPQDIVDVLAKLKSGDSIKLMVRRGENEVTLTVKAGDRNGKAYLGMTPVGQTFSARPMPDDFPETPGLPMVEAQMIGGSVAIEAVTKDSPADKAGLKVGDAIESVDGIVIAMDKSLADLIAAKKPGDVVTLTVKAKTAKDTQEVKVTLGENPDKKGAAYLGIRYRPNVMMFNREMPEMTMPLGAMVGKVQPDSAAAKAGIQDNDLIKKLDGKTITDTQMLMDAVAAYKPGDTVTVTVERANEGKELSVTLGAKADDKTKAFLGVQLWPGPRVFMRRFNGGLLPAPKTPENVDPATQSNS